MTDIFHRVELDMRHLRMVVAVAESGSVTKAAAALGIAQPALTAQLNRIDRSLGGNVFVRDRFGARPTELGDLILRHARVLLPAMAALSDDAERLVSRPKDATDAAEPAGQSALAGALGTYAALTGSTRHRSAAESAVAAAGGLARQAPRFAGWTLAVAEALATGPLQVAVVGPDDAARAALEHVARRAASPGLVITVGEPDAPGLPLLADRPLVDGGAAAYVCRGFVCDRPVTTPEDLATALGA